MFLSGIENNRENLITRKLLCSFNLFLFDVDDTLLRTFQNGFNKINGVADDCGLSQVSYETYHRWYGCVSFEECLRIWFPNADIEMLSTYYERQKKKYPYLPVCDFGSIQEKIERQYGSCGILTNGKHNPKLFEKLRIAGVDIERLAGIWGREDLLAPKPDPRAFGTVRKKYPNARIVYFGDANIDAQMCREADVFFIQVLTGKDSQIAGVCSLNSVEELNKIL